MSLEQYFRKLPKDASYILEATISQVAKERSWTSKKEAPIRNRDDDDLNDSDKEIYSDPDESQGTESSIVHCLVL